MAYSGGKVIREETGLHICAFAALICMFCGRTLLLETQWPLAAAKSPGRRLNCVSVQLRHSLACCGRPPLLEAQWATAAADNKVTSEETAGHISAIAEIVCMVLQSQYTFMCFVCRTLLLESL